MSDNKSKNSSASDSGSELMQYADFQGISELSISVRIPSSFYSAVKEYSRVANIRPTEWFNNAIIDMIQSIELGHLNDTFTEKYHLNELSREKRDAMIQGSRRFKLVEETLSDA